MSEIKNAGTGIIPVYRHSAEYAISNNELSEYRASFKANMECKAAIEEAIHLNYHDNRLDTKNISVQLGQKYGIDRVAYILAATIQAKNWDGRFSDSNKTWAASIPITEDKTEWGENRNRQFVIDGTHPGLVDLLASQVRKELTAAKEQPEKKPSVLEKIQKPSSPAKGPAVPKKIQEEVL